MKSVNWKTSGFYVSTFSRPCKLFLFNTWKESKVFFNLSLSVPSFYLGRFSHFLGISILILTYINFFSQNNLKTFPLIFPSIQTFLYSFPTLKKCLPVFPTLSQMSLHKIPIFLSF